MQSYAAELNGITLVREHRRTPAWVVAIIYADAIMLHVSRARVCLYYSNLAAQQRTPVFISITVRYSIIIDIVCRLCRAYEIVANPMLFSNEVCFNNRRKDERRRSAVVKIERIRFARAKPILPTGQFILSKKTLQIRAIWYFDENALVGLEICSKMCFWDKIRFIWKKLFDKWFKGIELSSRPKIWNEIRFECFLCLVRWVTVSKLLLS